MASQMHAEREDFERVLQAQEDLIRAEEAKLAAEIETRRQNVAEIQAQIKERERERMLERKVRRRATWPAVPLP